MKKPTTPEKRQQFFNWNGVFIGILILLLLNTLLAPYIGSSQIKDSDYGTFISELNKGKVSKVVIKDGYVYYDIPAAKAKNSAKSSKTVSPFMTPQNEPQTYRTPEVNDPQLVDRLLKAKAPTKSGKVEISKEVPQKSSPLVDFFVWWILPALIFWWIWRAGTNKMMKGGLGGGGGFLSVGKSGAKVYAESDVKTRFSDVAGQDEAKATLMELVDFLHNPKKYTSLGARLPKGALLVGPPGTGKTLIARAVAGEAHVPFFSISGSEFVQMFVGMGAAKVRDLFKQAGEKAPCIVFIDEIDAIGKKRDSAGIGGNDEREQTLNQLLAEMDGFDSSKGVVLLAATNRPETLDPALLRPGRFDRRVPVELPDLQGRIAILKVHAKHVRIDGDVDWNIIARATAGASGAELANIINEGALRAVRQGRKTVRQEDLEESVETVIAGAQRKNAVISPKEKEIVAYHETGHALVAALQSHSAPVTKITIVPRTSGALGYTMQVDEGDHSLMSKAEVENKIATLTGGRAAEELIFGAENITTGASNDIEQATKLSRAMITRYGMTDEFDMVALETVQNQYLGGDSSLTCSAETAAKIDQQVVSTVKAAHQKALDILRANESKLHQLSKYLLEKETITGEEFMHILNG